MGRLADLLQEKVRQRRGSTRGYLLSSLAVLCLLGIPLAAQTQDDRPDSAAAQPIKVGRLLIEGKSSYRIQEELKRAQYQTDERNPFFPFFGTSDLEFIRMQVTDVHQPLLPLLAQELQKANLALVLRPGAPIYRLSFEITNLIITTGSGRLKDNGQPRGRADLGWKIMVQHLLTRKTVFQKSSVTSLLGPATSGKNTLATLLQTTAQEMARALAPFWDEVQKVKE